MNERTFTDDTLRTALLEFLRRHWPVDATRPMAARLHGQAARDWLRVLGGAGWKAPAWPTEFGGLGLSLHQQLIYQAVMNQYGAPRVIDLGVNLVGPIIMKYGTDAQKADILPKILDGTDIWCQGYSEPGAGSDLANLRTSACIEGDALVINGQKLWTTQASYANRMFMLVRTGGGSRKQEGITFVVLDLPHQDVTVRPIDTLSGETEFSEVFFDDARVPLDNVVGPIGDGWRVAKALLGHERLSIGSTAQAKQALRVLVRLLAEAETPSDAALHADLERLAADFHDIQCLYDDICAATIAGEKLDAEYSMMKILSSELFQRTATLALRAAGERSALREEIAYGDSRIDLHHAYMLSRPVSIYSGTNEIQRNIVARGLFED